MRQFHEQTQTGFLDIFWIVCFFCYKLNPLLLRVEKGRGGIFLWGRKKKGVELQQDRKCEKKEEEGMEVLQASAKAVLKRKRIPETWSAFCKSGNNPFHCAPFANSQRRPDRICQKTFSRHVQEKKSLKRGSRFCIDAALPYSLIPYLSSHYQFLLGTDSFCSEEGGSFRAAPTTDSGPLAPVATPPRH